MYMYICMCMHIHNYIFICIYHIFYPFGWPYSFVCLFHTQLNSCLLLAFYSGFIFGEAQQGPYEVLWIEPGLFADAEKAPYQLYYLSIPRATNNVHIKIHSGQKKNQTSMNVRNMRNLTQFSGLAF